MKRNWLFINNTFETQTRFSNVKALRLFRDFWSKLSAHTALDPYIAAIFADFDVAYKEYDRLHTRKDAAAGIYKGRTLNFGNEIGRLPELLRVWEGQIHYHFPEGSIEDTELFPRRRTPFLTGSYDDRVNAVRTLAINLGNYPVLNTLQAQVQTYYDTLMLARDMQQQKEGLNDQLSTLLEEQRIITATEMWGGYARLLYYYRYNPERVLDFIDIELLRTSSIASVLVTFNGKITDINGNVIANATISLPQIGIEATTDSLGKFSMDVESGTWNIEIEAAGYQTFTQNNVIFPDTGFLTMDFVLSV